MPRYHLNHVGLNHIQLWEEEKTPDNNQKTTYNFSPNNIIQYNNSENGQNGMSICADLNSVIIGIPNENKVVVYHLENGSWLLKTILVGSNDELFGFSVCIQGNRIVVGAPNASNGMGKAYLYEYNNNEWVPSDTPYIIPYDSNIEISGNYGHSVVINNNTIAIGCPNGFGGSTNEERYGCVYMYYWGAYNKNLYFSKKITAMSTQHNSLFGWALSMNNENTISISSPNENISYGTTYINNGSVYVYEKISNNWSFRIKIIPNSGQENLYWGYSLSFRKNYLLIGMPGYVGGGGACLYYGSSDTYTFQQKFLSRVDEGLIDSTVDNSDKQGYSVAFDSSHNTVLLGTPYNNNIGCVYSWTITNAGNWLPSLSSKIVPIETQNNINFGLAISHSYNNLFVGSPGWDNSKGGYYILKNMI